MGTKKTKIRAKSRGDYHHGELRRALLEAALQMIDEKGPAEVSTRALARRLGVSHAAPARHFPDRATLLGEVAVEAFGAFERALTNAAATSDDPSESFGAMGRAYVRFAMEHPGHVRLMFGRELSDLEPVPERLQVAASHAYEVLLGGVRRVLGPRARPEKVDAAAFAAWAQVHGAANLWLDGPFRHSPQGERAAAAAFLRLSDVGVDAIARAISGMSG
jgi:AcrR family transcriptional regulator